MVQFAAQHGAVDVMKYARKHGCPWERPRPPWHDTKQRKEWNEPLSTMREAAGGGFTAFVEAAHALGCPWGAFPMGLAAKKGHLVTMQVMHALGCPIDGSVAYHAAKASRTDMLHWLHAVHAPMERACAGAACHSKKAGVKDTNEDVDEGAPLELMKAARALGGEWSTGVLEELIDNCMFKTMRWVLEQGCTFPASELEARACPRTK